MPLLASELSHGGAVAVVILCIVTVALILFDVLLLLSLHRGNKKLADYFSLPTEERSEAEKPLEEDVDSEDGKPDKHNI